MDQTGIKRGCKKGSEESEDEISRDLLSKETEN